MKFINKLSIKLKYIRILCNLQCTFIIFQGHSRLKEEKGNFNRKVNKGEICIVIEKVNKGEICICNVNFGHVCVAFYFSLRQLNVLFKQTNRKINGWINKK